jgi:polysaccharide export outer membrane protein
LRASGQRAARYAAMAVFILALSPLNGTAFQEEKATSANDYKIGPKDVLEIKVFELPELNQTVRVAEDGSISLTLLGKVDVAGLTTQELEKSLASILDQQYTKAAHVTVFVIEHQKVAIFGAVGKPGNYELVGPMTLLQVISLAGGLTPDAMNELYIFRTEAGGEKERIAIDLRDLIGNGNQVLNIELQPGDVVNIPVDQTLTVFVYGEVKNPGAIQFKQSKKITLLQAIAQAGGPTEWAKSRVSIKRKDLKTGKEMRIPVNLKDVIAGKISDIILVEGDVIIVP